MRGMGLILLALGAGTLSVSAAFAQSKPQFKIIDATRWDFSIGYNNIRANAPPSQCQCFNMNGGFVFGSLHLTDWLGIEGQFTGGHSSNISPLGQGLTLTTFTAGPRVSHRFRRFTPYGEVLVGGAHGSDSYFPSNNTSSTSASSFAVSTGGGLDFRLTPRFSIRALDMQYLRTSLPNGVSNEQSQLMIGAGLVIKFQERSRETPAPAPVQAAVPPPPPPPPPPVVAFTCDTNVANVPLGQMVAITGDAKTEPGNLDVDYSWSTDGGAIEGSGKVVSINTTGMAIGDYRVKGHASLISTPSISGDCVAVFRVIAVEPPPASSNTYVTIEKNEREFHENVKDAYFDVNSAKIKPDTLATIIHAAQYLVAHPKIQVIISGWADPRGSADYNLILGIKRANAVRSALLDAGVPPSQLEVISNGKSSQVCTTKDQKCWQQNRRVSYVMKP
jgi:outer membrane protein OmpA-like peptidoglycan-associated protein/opacity protein-like surface antigen